MPCKDEQDALEYADRLVGEGVLDRKYDYQVASLFYEAIIAERNACIAMAKKVPGFVSADCSFSRGFYAGAERAADMLAQRMERQTDAV